MFDKMKQLMEMKRQADQMKRELDNTSLEANEVSGINIKINGSMNFQSIEIDESLIDVQNKTKLENDLLRSLNLAIKKSQDLAAEKMKAVMPSIPGL